MKQLSWKKGKTKASIRFAARIKTYLKTCTNEQVAGVLRQAFSEVISGTLILQQNMSVQEYLRKILPTN